MAIQFGGQAETPDMGPNIRTIADDALEHSEYAVSVGAGGVHIEPIRAGSSRMPSRLGRCTPR